MNKAIAILALLFTGGCLIAQTTPKVKVDHYNLEKSADVVIYYDPDNSRPMKISINPRKDDKTNRVTREEKFSTTSKSLKKFFDGRPRKDLIVIIYEKNVLDDSHLFLVSIRLKDYFVARGFKQIYIGQANSAGPPIPLLEYPKSKPSEAPQTHH